MIGHTRSHDGVVQSQSPVFPTAEKQTASELLIESTCHNREILVCPGHIIVCKRSLLKNARIAYSSRCIGLKLNACRKAPVVIIHLEIVVGTETAVRNGCKCLGILEIHIGVGLKTACHMTPVTFLLLFFFIFCKCCR